MTTFERSSAEELITEAGVIEWRLQARYNRSPEKRKEARLDMTTADDLQRRRAVMTLTEFSPTWNRRKGELP